MLRQAAGCWLDTGMNLLSFGPIHHHGQPAPRIGCNEILCRIVADVDEAVVATSERRFQERVALRMRLSKGPAPQGVGIDNVPKVGGNTERCDLAHLHAVSTVRDQPKLQAAGKMC